MNEQSLANHKSKMHPVKTLKPMPPRSRKAIARQKLREKMNKLLIRLEQIEMEYQELL